MRSHDDLPFQRLGQRPITQYAQRIGSMSLAQEKTTERSARALPSLLVLDFWQPGCAGAHAPHHDLMTAGGMPNFGLDLPQSRHFELCLPRTNAGLGLSL
jgi:hypothetical protein